MAGEPAELPGELDAHHAEDARGGRWSTSRHRSNSLENGVFGDRVSQRIALYPNTARFKLFANIPIDDDKNVFVGDRQADYPRGSPGFLRMRCAAVRSASRSRIRRARVT